jgi:thiosulfate/3-mercaptopyruvate sulfurtransferase
MAVETGSPAAGFPNAHLLWSPAQLHARLGDERLALLDVRPSHEVMTGIIPGAAHLDLYGVGLTRTTPELFEEWVHLMRSLLGLRGVGMDKTVVLYEEHQTGIRAARAFWLLEYFGHGDVHVLDGGIRAWREDGYETTQEMAAPRPARLPIAPQAERFVSADDLHALLGQPDLLPLDTRTDDEHYGRNTRGGPRGGTIPGAVHLEWTNTLDERGRMKPAAELAALFERHGVTRDKRIVPF